MVPFSTECVKKNCNYYLHLDSSVYLDNPDTLRLLIEQNRPIVAPLLKQKDAAKWNFRGSIISRWDREYGFLPPAMDFVKNNRRYIMKLHLISYDD